MAEQARRLATRRLEPWRDPRYLICPRTANVPEARKDRGARDGCCDCESECYLNFGAMLARLTAAYVVICFQCARQREIEHGGMGWIKNVKPQRREP